jgi:uncharacterized lipoprotein YajG
MLRKIVAIALAVLALAACTTRPIDNVSAEPVIAASGTTVTMDHVRDAILRAGARRGWIENLNNAIRMELLRA